MIRILSQSLFRQTQIPEQNGILRKDRPLLADHGGRHLIGSRDGISQAAAFLKAGENGPDMGVACSYGVHNP